MIGIFVAGLVLVALLFFVTHKYPFFGQMSLRASKAVLATYFGFRKRHVQLSEQSLCFYESKESEGKPVLLMIHGYSADKSNWLYFARHFTKDYHIVIPDLAGHGETGFHSDWRYTVDAQAKRLDELITALSLGEVNLIGSSMGGMISAFYTSHYPQRVKSTVLFDPSGLREPLPSRRMQILLSENRNVFEIHSQQDFDEFYALTMSKPPWLPMFMRKAVAIEYQDRRDQLRQIGMDFHLHFIDDEVVRITQPLLLIWGDEDQIIDKSCVDVWQGYLPHINVEIWPGIGHLPMLEAPKMSADRVRKFLQQGA
ncbi:alpha/beta fold hydrolase [Veronia pacifica]|uniref:AB hydrolase-1 domain-containing protein n=1 Tax=Veronia pacifica TaxID=1080227 RepID=A0A1C3EGR5_9GAMM|nr:alpha/beta hydrolase [Veronia pacifica]ODA32456.1 hypothetical protein A8L45_12730 [Veronia pacifica]